MVVIFNCFYNRFLAFCVCGVLSLKSTENGRKSDHKWVLKIGRVDLPLDLNVKNETENFVKKVNAIGAWSVPDYRRAWIVYDRTLNRYKEVLKIQDNANINLLAFLYTMHGLTKRILDTGWDFYAHNYTVVAKQNLETALNNPSVAAKAVSCYLEAIQKKNKLMSLIMENCWIKFVCTEKPEACNPTLFLIVKMTSVRELEDEADFLLTFNRINKENDVKRFIKMYDDVSKDAVKFVENGREIFQELLATNVKIQEKLFFDGKDHCMPNL